MRSCFGRHARIELNHLVAVCLRSDQVMEKEKLSQDHAEFESLQNHFDKYLHDLRAALGQSQSSSSHPSANPNNPTTTRKPTRHTASAAAAAKISSARKVSDSRFLAKPIDRIKPKKPRILPVPKSEDLGEYVTENDWKGRTHGGELDVTDGDRSVTIQEEGDPRREDDILANIRRFDGNDLSANPTNPAPLTSLWTQPFITPTVSLSHLKPERVLLRGKITKRCLTCNHTLIRPESKASSLRYKIKILAGTYIPAVELGNRRRMVEKESGAGGLGASTRRMSGLNIGKGMTEEREGLHLPLKRDTMVRSSAWRNNICS